MRTLLILCLLSFTGCSSWHKEVKVIHATGDIEIKKVQIDDGDIVACDSKGCRVVKP